MPKQKFSKGLVTQSLEHISKDIFSKYSSLITQLIEKSSGVYALYDENELYYVGRATQLRTRVKQHLRDRHDASWTHFSLFLVSKDDHIGEIESLLIRIANPKGNTIKPKGRDSRKLQKQLKSLIKQKHKEELSSLFSIKSKVPKKIENQTKDIKGLVKKRTPIYRTYKGKEYKAMLNPTGTIKFKNHLYTSPTAAAMAVVERKTVNGWTFWYIRNKASEWVRLSEYNS